MTGQPIALTSEVQPQQPHQFLHHFRIDRTLAAGGMGAVYLGYDTSLNRPVAIKVIRPELASMAGFAERFVREAQAQAQIAHSNVVQVYFIGQQQGTWYIVMELVDGGSLAGAGKLDWRDAVRHMNGLAQGLREAARLGIVHRDIKPANVLLDRFGLAHLADFGLAAAVDSGDPGMANTPALQGGGQEGAGGSLLPKLTQLGAIMGSPGYMSPEQAHGQPLDARADMFSLGATFFEVLTGEPPVKADSIPAAQRFYKTTTRIPPVRTRAPAVPRPFAAIVDRCLALDPARRFPDYDALLMALDRAAPEPIVPATPLQRLLSFALDVAVFAAVARFTIQTFPLAGFLALGAWVALGAAWLRATPGQWLMRLHLRTTADTEPTPAACALRFLLQHGHLAFAALTVSAIYRSAGEGLTLVSFVAAAALGALSVLGSLGALFTRRKQALHDLLTRTMVLVNTR